MEWKFLKELLVSKLKLVKLGKYFMYVAPIYGITHNIYVSLYGTYQFQFSNTELLLKYSTGVTLFVFFSLVLFAHFLEKNALPAVLSILSPMNLDREMKIRTYKISKTMTNMNPFGFIRGFPRIEIYSELMALPVILIMWLLYINTWWSYVSLLLVFFILYWFAKILNAAQRQI